MRNVGIVSFPSGNLSAIAAGDGGSPSRLQLAQPAQAGRRKNPSKPPFGTFTNKGE
jgi:hypothetical protein